MARIKICGISTPDTLDAVIGARADCVGFNFFPPSPRHVALGDLAALSARAGHRLEKVGVYVDPDDELLAATIAAGSSPASSISRSRSVPASFASHAGWKNTARSASGAAW